MVDVGNGRACIRGLAGKLSGAHQRQVFLVQGLIELLALGDGRFCSPMRHRAGWCAVPGILEVLHTQRISFKQLRFAFHQYGLEHIFSI